MGDKMIIKQLRAKLEMEADNTERGYIIEQIELWERKLEIEPRGVDHLLIKGGV